MGQAEMTLALDTRTQVLAGFRRKRLIAFALPALLLAYLAYAFVAFDIPGLAQRARGDNAAIMLADAVSYKIHVTQDNRRGGVSVSVEGNRRAVFAPHQIPDWVRTEGAATVIDLGRGHTVTYDGPVISYAIPDFGTLRMTVGETIGLDLPPGGELPRFVNASDGRVAITTEAGRVIVTRARADTYRYFPGWELFFFDLQSPFHDMTWGQVAASIFSDRQVVEGRSNLVSILHDFWNNGIWRHGEVAWAIFETALMAFLGTFGAAFVALPLAFFAAQNFAPSRLVRFGVRRLFDFVRGVDALIFTIILSRAFGPGPLTGALAILITDSGSFGKLFSEALENVDTKPIDGVQSTGANAAQRYRFGVIPQVMPVLLSQMLYFLESNTRSATIIGAIVGGGIGLMLTQAIQTTSDWEKVTYYILLIILLVILMDTLSGWLRRRLIKGE